MTIQNGIKEPYIKKTQQGRPAKEITITPIPMFECQNCPKLEEIKLALKSILEKL